MHRQWTSGALASVLGVGHGMPPPKSLFLEHNEDDDDDDLPNDDANAVESSQEHHGANLTSPTIVDVDEHTELTHDTLAETSPLKFETPALAGRKRVSPGQLLSSAVCTTTTPSTVASASAFGAAFGNVALTGVPGMSLTQIWNNTQAPTSPAVAGATDDVAFTRPSPNFDGVHHSSPGPAYSSPIKDMRPNTPASEPMLRSSSEPRTEYITMRQSHEKRRGCDGEEIPAVDQQDSLEDFSRQMQPRSAKKLCYEQAARSLSHTSAPPTLPRRLRRPKLNTECPTQHAMRVANDVHHGEPQESDTGPINELSQPSPVNSHSSDSSDHELLTTQTTMKHNSNGNKVQVPKTSSHPCWTPSFLASRKSSQQPAPSSQPQLDSQLRAPGSWTMPPAKSQLHSTIDSVAIMDSQPDVLGDFDSVPPSRLLRFPSSPSQNQYSIHQTTMATKTGYTSQAISSSMPPMPPNSSQDELVSANEEAVTPEDERVPSSPPILAHDEDIEYDEHAYDEYAEGIVDDEVAELVADEMADNDVEMAGDDELPFVKQEPFNAEVENNEEEVDAEEMGLMHPQKVDRGTDQEVPETLEEDPMQSHSPDEAEPTHERPREIPRLERQNTVPETDALEDRQFPVDADNAINTGHSIGVLSHTSSTETSLTAQDEHTDARRSPKDHNSSKDAGSLTMEASNRIQSIDDIYNLPETQQSVGANDLEIPRLSGLDEEEGSLQMASSPAPPSAKKRKITYRAKRNVFRSPAKPASSVLSDPPTSSPLGIGPPPPMGNSLTASVRLREDRGADAAANIREEAQDPSRPATLKAKTLPRCSKLQARRKGALKSVSKDLLQSLSTPASPASKSNPSDLNCATTPATPTKSTAIANHNQQNMEMAEIDDELDELATVVPPAVPLERLLGRMSQKMAIPIGEALVPNRVFASWPGTHYYPATCIGRATSRQLRIRYDDGNTTEIDAVHVRSLDLRAGDHVKVDKPGMKKHIYVVVGFKDKVNALGDEQFPSTDRYGHATIVVEEKRRDSMPAYKENQPTEHVSVPMASIYLTAGLWTRLRDRLFHFSPPPFPMKSASHIGTPVVEQLTTPSFTRRGVGVPSFLKSANARAVSVASTARSGGTVFANMAFVLTSTADDFNKDSLARSIKSNGGIVLEHGFHELFDYESSDASSSPGRRRSSSPARSVSLTLKPAYKDIGFVALISDSHSRSTKYIQALALNVPCLHLRWIHDSLSTARAAAFIKYLLPAGVSKFLDPRGVVRSRTMRSYDPAAEDLCFADTLRDRPLLLNNQNVLLVTGTMKKEIEKRQPFIFLTHALGSARVGRCADLVDASEMLTEDHWDWVYVDNNELGVVGAAAELFGTEIPPATGETKPKKGTKRKREYSEGRGELVARVTVGGKRVRVTCSEFLIQSLILEALVEE